MTQGKKALRPRTVTVIWASASEPAVGRSQSPSYFCPRFLSLDRQSCLPDFAIPDLSRLAAATSRYKSKLMSFGLNALVLTLYRATVCHSGPAKPVEPTALGLCPILGSY